MSRRSDEFVARQKLLPKHLSVDEVVDALAAMDPSRTQWFYGYEVRNHLIDSGRPCSYQALGNALRWGHEHGRIDRDQIEDKRALWKLRMHG